MFCQRHCVYREWAECNLIWAYLHFLLYSVEIRTQLSDKVTPGFWVSPEVQCRPAQSGQSSPVSLGLPVVTGRKPSYGCRSLLGSWPETPSLSPAQNHCPPQSEFPSLSPWASLSPSVFSVPCELMYFFLGLCPCFSDAHPQVVFDERCVGNKVLFLKSQILVPLFCVLIWLIISGWSSKLKIILQCIKSFQCFLTSRVATEKSEDVLIPLTKTRCVTAWSVRSYPLSCGSSGPFWLRKRLLILGSLLDC